MYFRGDCTPPGLPNVNFDVLSEFDSLSPSTVNIWMWVVASLSLLWLFASVALLTSENFIQNSLQLSNIYHIFLQKMSKKAT